MNITDRFIYFFAFIVLLLIATGGFYIEGPGYFIDLAKINTWAVLLGVCLLIRSKQNGGLSASPPYNKFIDIIKWGEKPNSTKKKAYITATIVFGLLFLNHCLRQWTLNTYVFDNGVLHQALFNPFGETFFLCDICRNGSWFAEHITWTLVPLAVISQWLESDIFIFFVQTATVAGTLLYFIFKGPLKEHKFAWFWFLVLVILSKPLRNSQFWDFREDNLAFGFLLLTCLFLYKGSMIWSFLFIVLSALTKENIPATTLMLVFPILFAKEIPWQKNKRIIFATLVGAFSLGYTLYTTKITIPYFMGDIEHANPILARFPGMGETMSEFVLNIFKNPFQFVALFGKNLFSPDSIKYIIYLIGPFVLLLKRSWIWLLPALPGIMGNVLIEYSNQRMMVFHYELIILPFFVAAAAFTLKSYIEERTWEPKKWLPVLVLGLCVAGRPPLIHITNGLRLSWHKVTAHLDMKSWSQVDTSLASTDNFLTQFNHLNDVRNLKFPRTSPPEDRISFIKEFIGANGKSNPGEQYKDAHGAQFFLIDNAIPHGKRLIEELKYQGLEISAIAKDFHGNPVATLIETKRSPFDYWCKEDNICRSDLKDD